jgi:DNA-binding transcriptional LysR family regulator
MDRDLLIHLPIILAVARRAGFAAAASELGMSPSAVSHAVRLVEERLGVPLFARTTRSVSLTEAGRALVDAAEPALRDIGERVEHIRAAKGRVSGLLRLNVPNPALPIMTPVVGAMAERFPSVTGEVYADDAIVDIVAAGFDAGVRLGEMIAEDMVAVRLTPPFATTIVASPAYLAAHGRPKNIADLKNHNCITYRMITAGGLYRWELLDGGGRSRSNGPAAPSSTMRSMRGTWRWPALGSPIFSSR